jgi:hypothetical protein
VVKPLSKQEILEKIDAYEAEASRCALTDIDRALRIVAEARAFAREQYQILSMYPEVEAIPAK